MRKRHRAKLVHEGDVELIDTDDEWSPYLSLDDVRMALRNGDLGTATRHARVFSLTPVAV